MARQVLLRVGAGLTPESVEWASVDARGEVQSEPARGTLAEAGEAARGQAVVVALSGTDALLTGATVPGRNRSRAQAAIPFMLEEGLVEDVAAYHFVSAPPDRGGHYPVVVVQRAFMDRMLAQLQEVGITPSRVVCEVELLDETVWTVLADGGEAMVRLGRGRGFATELDALALLLQAARGEIEPPLPEAPPLQVFGDAGDLSWLDGYTPEQKAARSALVVLARGLARPAVNLLQADYGRANHLRRVLRHYRLSAALAVVLGVLLAVGGALEFRRIQAHNAQLSQDIENVLRETFPDLRRVVNPRTQMRQRLSALRKESRGGSGFLELLNAAAGPVAAMQDVQLNGMVFRRGRLDLDVEASDLRNLDALQSEIARQPSLAVSIESAKSEQQKVRGRLRVSRAGES